MMAQYADITTFGNNKGCSFHWCPNQPPVGNGTCESCLDRVRDEDSEAEYDDYAAYLTEKLQ